MFASKTPRDLNHDPEPWTGPWGEDRHGPIGGWSSVWSPRPEFDHVQHNEPNPILVAFRSGKYPAGYWAHRLAKGDLPVAVDKASTNEIDHARRVLARLTEVGS